jgi:hypothetical protein
MIDARIPLMVREPQPPTNPIRLMRDVMGAREDMAQMQDAAQQRAEAEQLRKIYQEVGIDPRKRAELLQRVSQVNPIMAEKLRAQWVKEELDAREAQTKAQTAQFEELQKRATLFKSVLPYTEPIVQMMGQYKTNPEVWAKGKGLLGGLARLVGAESLVDQIPDQPSDEAYKVVAGIPQWGQDQTKTLDEFTMWFRQRTAENKGVAPSSEEIQKFLASRQAAATDRIVAVTHTNEKNEEVTSYMPESQASGQTFVKKAPPAEPVVFDQRPDPETANKIIPGIGSTPNSIWQDGIQYAVSGQMPTLGMGSGAGISQTRQSIRNTGNALIAKSGMDAPTIRTAYSANKKSLDRMVPLYNQTVAFANSALASLDYAMEAGEKVWNAGVPTANRMRNWLSGTLAPNEKLSAFEVFVFTAARDYAKVTSGGALSIAELSVAAAQKADELLNSAQSPEQFKAAAGAMRQDMANVMDTQRQGIGGVSETIARFLDTTNPSPVTGEDFAKRVTAGSSGRTGATAPPSTQLSRPPSAPAPTRVRVRAPNGQEAWLSPEDAKKAIAAGATEVK